MTEHPAPENRRIFPGDAGRGEIQIVQERLVWANDTARLWVDRVRFPDGNGEGDQFRLGPSEQHGDGVIVVPITADDRILLVRQFRHPVRMWLRELPRGASNRDEAPADAAARELREEIGCEVETSVSLGRIANDSGQLVGFPHLFAARVRQDGPAEPEATEAISGIFAYTFSELKRACQRGEIVDSFTLAAVTRLEPHFDGDRFRFRPDAAPPEEPA